MSSFIAATRPVRRDMFGRPGRLTAAVILIALAVAAVVGMGVYTESNNPKFVPAEAQTVSGRTGNPTAAELENALPAGYSLDVSARVLGVFTASAGSGQAAPYSSMVEQYPRELLLEDLPITPGTGEVVLAHPVAETLGIKKGETVAFRAEGHPQLGSATLTVVGIVPGFSSLVGPDSLLTMVDVLDNPAAAAAASFTITGPQPLDAQQRQAMFDQGFEVQRLHGSPYPYMAGDGSKVSPDFFFLFLNVIPFLTGFLFIFLFLSPAFALALSRHTRMFALMAAQGATRTHIAMAVLSFALFAGVLGATLGVALGCAAGWVAVSLQTPDWEVSWPVTFIACAWAVALIGCLVAASIPAYLAGKSALSSAMLGANPDRMLRWKKWMAVGPVICALVGIALAVGTSKATSGAFIAFAPYFLLLPGMIGFALSAPAVVLGMSKLGTRAPMVWRTAARGLGRSSMRAIPAVAALLCASSLFTFSSSSMLTHDATAKAQLLLGTPRNVALITAGDKETIADVGSILTQRLGASTEVPLFGPATPRELAGGAKSFRLTARDAPACDGYYGATYTSFLSVGYGFPGTSGHGPDKDPREVSRCLARIAQDNGPSTSYDFYLTKHLIGGQELLDLVVFDSPDDRAKAAKTLAAGGIVLPRGSGFIPEGSSQPAPTVKIQAISEAVEELQDEPVTKETTAALEVSESISHLSRPVTLLSPEAARALELNPTLIGAALVYPQDISGAEATAAHREVDERNLPISRMDSADSTPEDGSRDIFGETLTADVYFAAQDPQVSQPFVGPLFLAALVIITMLLVTALSAATLRRENRAFAAIGAAPGFGAKVAALQTFLISSAALALGFVSGQLAVLATSTGDLHAPTGELLALGTLGYQRLSWPVLLASLGAVAVSTALTWVIHRQRRSDCQALVGGAQEDRLLA
ncbi:hypothetical protein CPHO_08885 [Corynebacterium phocae]|uniref:ABC3 transporter permease C-terminal domain-containing protein n=1 Tax=Corynebacterium phocae TaxID=161895 RepID=A0A1L7D4B9_9CORY|nr:FtsX-like permease family protein [Corynebacterium phocae]APT92984.1 hypothetical protein CPHO_08885 [Corynebacterium phocae]KAA8723322.1 FtsX-like permease family protein [Corynebacterium phocae]